MAPLPAPLAGQPNARNWPSILPEVLRSKKALGWRTLLVVPELDAELEVLAGCKVGPGGRGLAGGCWWSGIHATVADVLTHPAAACAQAQGARWAASGADPAWCFAECRTGRSTGARDAIGRAKDTGCWARWQVTLRLPAAP